MHPIIYEYSNSDAPLLEILRKLHDPNHFCEAIFLKVVELCTENKHNFSVLIQEIDEAIMLGHADANLYILFLSYTITAATIKKQKEKATFIRTIALSLSLKEIEPSVCSYFYISLSNFESMTTRTRERNRLIQKGLKLLTRKSPRYLSHLWSKLFFDAQKGELNNLDPLDMALIKSLKGRDYNKYYLYPILLNCIDTADHKTGFQVFEEIKTIIKNPPSYYDNFIEIFRIYSGDLNHEHYTNDLIKIYIKTILAIRNGLFTEAHARLSELKNHERSFWTMLPFEDTLAIHLALNEKKIGLAKILLNEMIQKEALPSFVWVESIFAIEKQYCSS